MPHPNAERSHGATPNLPARDFSVTSAFYASLGFEQGWRDTGWMILRLGGIQLEFFPFHDLDPATSSFSCCLRLDDLAAFYERALATGIPEKRSGWPRLHAATVEHSGMTIAYLVDPDGTLLRLVQNPAET